MHTAALVLGIVSLVIAIGGGAAGMGWIGSVCGILAIIFGALGMKAGGEQKKTAKTGMILGIVALCWGLIVTVACITCIGAGASILDGMGFFD
ncbi:MAG: hypothetical protein IKX70_00295 [Treponema sp.]|jgi:hypothetical protein|nr:hypothetical protein [Treponema sp.]MBR5032093.1 hypothetical protein [Treponema sp.]